MALSPYYDQDGIAIYHGNCREIAAFLNFDAILSDPPYGVGLAYSADARDDRQTFRDNAQWLASRGVATAFTIPSTRLFDVPRPQWVGVWHKPMTFGFWRTPLIPHWESVATRKGVMKR